MDSPTSEGNVRKRVGKACDRCRLKKSKCDGASPCSRCKADNTICVFGERKKTHEKIYPKGYVEMLEQQQSQLVAGLRELYKRLQDGQSWPGAPLPEGQGGHPLTHDILERLDLLHLPSSEANSPADYDGFEEDCNRLQKRLRDSGAPYIRRRGGSVSSSSDHEHRSSPSSNEGTPAVRSLALSEAFLRSGAPPTPPLNSPFQSQQQQNFQPQQQQQQQQHHHHQQQQQQQQQPFGTAAHGLKTLQSFTPSPFRSNVLNTPESAMARPTWVPPQTSMADDDTSGMSSDYLSQFDTPMLGVMDSNAQAISPMQGMNPLHMVPSTSSPPPPMLMLNTSDWMDPSADFDISSFINNNGNIATSQTLFE